MENSSSFTFDNNKLLNNDKQKNQEADTLSSIRQVGFIMLYNICS